MLFFALLLYIDLIPLVSATGESTLVFEVTSENIHEFTSKDMVLLEFYAPWFVMGHFCE
jgi:hypothetical protein